jgi:hypothetical protein
VKPHVRAIVAYSAGRLISGQYSSSLYHHQSGGRHTIDGSMDGDRVNLYDYDRHCYCTGSRAGEKLNLYHHGDLHYVSLEIDGSRFRGCNYGSGQYFSGSVNGRLVSICDYEGGQIHAYSF